MLVSIYMYIHIIMPMTLPLYHKIPWLIFEYLTCESIKNIHFFAFIILGSKNLALLKYLLLFLAHYYLYKLINILYFLFISY